MRGQSPRSLIFPLCFEKLGNEGTVPSFPRLSPDFDDFSDVLGFQGLHQLTADAAFYRIEQFQPVLQRRIVDNLPRLRPAFARMKNPAVSSLLHIDFHALAGVVPPRPADIPFGHC